MVTYGLHANDDFLYVINGLRKLSSASASWFWPRPRPRPRRLVLGLGLGLKDLSSASALASRICPRLTSLLKCRREERTIVYKPETNLDNDRYKPTHSSTFGASSGFMRALNCYVNCTTTR